MYSENTSIHLVPPKVWQSIVAISISNNSLAMGILSALHNQHTGITPTLAYRVANMLEQQNGIYNTEPAKSIIRQLRDALKDLYDPLRKLNYPDSEQYPLDLRSSASYVVFKLIAPIADAVCEQMLGTTYLFSEDKKLPVDRYAYDVYQNKFDRAFLDVCSGKITLLPKTFWQDRALTIVNLTAQESDNVANLQPDSTLQDMNIFLNLNAPPAGDSSKKQKIHLPTPSHQIDPRMNDTGIDGVSMTTRVDEVHRRLISEYQYPYALQMDRIFNQGYLVQKPPPMPIKKRDILLMAIFPAGIFEDTIQTFLKTTWFNFTMYMTNILRSNGLDNSQIRWVEGDQLYRMRTNTLDLSSIEHLELSPVATLPPTFRHHYLRALEWFPDFMDNNSHFHRINLADNATAKHQAYPLLEHWFTGVWNMQVSRKGTQQTESVVNLEDYRFVYVMVFLPPASQFDDVRFLRRFVGLNPQHIAITTMPTDRFIKPDWTYQNQAVLSEDWYKQDDTNALMYQLSSVLIEKWIVGLMREMQRG